MAKKQNALPRNISFLEETIGYSFRNKGYVLEALRHSSYANENKHNGICSNERLEFLGDSVLSLVTSSYLFGLFSKYPEAKKQ